MSVYEILQDDNGRASSTRLSMLIGVVTGSIVVLWLAFTDALDGEIFLTYMAATGGVYGWGKYRESVEKTETIRASAPQPDAPTTNVTINQPDKANVSGT